MFCGERPESKNREHVIPRWLIRRTGDPKRNVFLGYDWTAPGLKQRRFAFDAFTFPACEACNASFAALEDRAQPIVEAILAHEAIGAADWSYFLDWLDKVRIGLWLGGIYLNKNHRGIEPRFHIQHRVGAADRFVVIYQMDDDGQAGVGWSNTDTPVFESMPSCFVLHINNFVFLSASDQLLFSRRFGFPYLHEYHVDREDGAFVMTWSTGTGIKKLPLVKWTFPNGGTYVWQPMIPPEVHEAFIDNESDQQDPREWEYAKRNCMDFSAGTGRVFLGGRKKLVVHPSEPSLDWMPKRSLPKREALFRTTLAAGRFLEKLYRDTMRRNLNLFPEEELPEYEEEVEAVLALHGAIMAKIVEQKNL